MKIQALDKKQLVRGQFKAEQALRPPWAVDEERFTDNCSRCFKCAESCPSKLIVKGRGGFPEMSFIRHGCDYCEACVKSCPENVLIKTVENSQIPWSQKATINNDCFSSRGIVCRACGDVCESRAIDFKLAVGGMSMINLNTANCDGCGDCVHVCPAQAITINKLTSEI